MHRLTEFDRFYVDALKKIFTQTPEVNRRTGHSVRAIHGLHHVFSKGLQLLTLRDINVKWFVLETLWSIHGDTDLQLFHKMGLKGWDKFAIDTPKGKFAEAGYGNRWRKAFGRDQLVDLLDGLSRDSSTRHGVLMTWDPRSDGLGQQAKPNVPCVMVWHFHCIQGELHLSVFQRSADMVIGYPHDVAGAGLLLKLLAAYLDMHEGKLSYTVSNAHVYDLHDVAADEMVHRYYNGLQNPDGFPLKKNNYMARPQTFHNALTIDDLNCRVRAVQGLTVQIEADYDPLPRIAGLELIE